MVASCPSLRCSCRKNLSYAEKQRVWSRSCGLQDLLRAIQWLCSQLCYVTAANQRTIVEIEIFATVNWTYVCQPFSCRCSQNVMHCRKDMCWTCLFKNPFPFPFWNSKPPLPTRSLRFPRAAVRSAISALNHGCIMPIPSLQLQKKPVICREAEGLVTELWSPRFVTIQWLCCHLCYVTAANQRTIVEIELLGPVSFTCGCQPFSCRCSQNDMHCTAERRCVGHVCLSNPCLL